MSNDKSMVELYKYNKTHPTRSIIKIKNVDGKRDVAIDIVELQQLLRNSIKNLQDKSKTATTYSNWMSIIDEIKKTNILQWLQNIQTAYDLINDPENKEIINIDYVYTNKPYVGHR